MAEEDYEEQHPPAIYTVPILQVWCVMFVFVYDRRSLRLTFCLFEIKFEVLLVINCEISLEDSCDVVYLTTCRFVLAFYIFSGGGCNSRGEDKSTGVGTDWRSTSTHNNVLIQIFFFRTLETTHPRLHTWTMTKSVWDVWFLWKCNNIQHVKFSMTEYIQMMGTNYKYQQLWITCYEHVLYRLIQNCTGPCFKMFERVKYKVKIYPDIHMVDLVIFEIKTKTPSKYKTILWTQFSIFFILKKVWWQEKES